MNVLAVEVRMRFERAISSARETAEAGARAALEALAAHLREPCEHLNPENRSLRRRLRAHGRQIGDRLDPRSGVQSLARLVHERTYEHWHGMLFARFLAKNNLLIASEWGDVSFSLKNCEDLGMDEDSPWFWNCPGDGPQADCTDFPGGADFEGNRWNDLHYRNAVKSVARDQKHA